MSEQIIMSDLIDTSLSNLGDAVERSLKLYCDRPAFECFGQTLTFEEIDEKSLAFACWLQTEAGLDVGDRIVIQLPNITQYPIVAIAAMRAGLIIVNTNPQYTANEMKHQFIDSGAKAIVIMDDLLPKLDSIISETKIGTVVTCSPTDLITLELSDIQGNIRLNKAIQIGTDLSLRPRKGVTLHDVCILQYTGGTTGISKGAALTHNNVLSNASQFMERLGPDFVNNPQVFISPLPLYHIYAFMLSVVSLLNKGDLSVLIPNPRDLCAFANTIKSTEFTGFAGINTLFVGLTMTPEFKCLDFSRLRLTLSGGSALTSDAASLWEEVTGCAITEGYGLSETSPILCLNKPGQERIGTVGQPVKGTIIEIWDQNEKQVTEGLEGEVVAKGPQVMQGYWNRSDESSKVMSRGFFKTGDVGKVLEDGSIKIVDRLKDMIIVSGFNVYPNEVEEALTQHSAIHEAAVIGQEDLKSGEKVCAYVVANNKLTKNESHRVCRRLIILRELANEQENNIFPRST